MGESSSSKCSAHAYIRVEPDQAKFAMGLRGHPHRTRNWCNADMLSIHPISRPRGGNLDPSKMKGPRVFKDMTKKLERLHLPEARRAPLQ